MISILATRLLRMATMSPEVGLRAQPQTTTRRAIERSPVDRQQFSFWPSVAKNRLKPGLRTLWDTTLRGSVSRL